MYTRTLASVLVLSLATLAHAGKIIEPNGGFEEDSLGVPGSAPRFTQTITDWTVDFQQDSPTVPGADLGDHSGVFNTYSLHQPEEGQQFFMMNNLGVGTVSLTGVTPFQITDQYLSFRYVYASHDNLQDIGGGDEFRVLLDIFSDAAGTNQIGNTMDFLVTDEAEGASTIGEVPFGGTGALFTYATGENEEFLPFVIPVQNFFGNYARLTFVVNNLGPVAQGGNSGIGLSGVLVDRIILTPEPSSIALLGLGVLGLGMVARRRRKVAKQA